MAHASSNGPAAGGPGASANGSRTHVASPRSIRLKVRRQDGPDAPSYWQEFEIPYVKGHNVLSVLMEIRKDPVDVSGKRVEPVVWEMACLEQVCGACSMVVNGVPRQGCTALVDELTQPIVVEPMDRFPIVRDLAVDRSRMFDNLKRVKAWLEIDGSHDLGPGPRQDPDDSLERYTLSTCMTCGVCLQVCPQYDKDKAFVGAQVLNQVRLFNSHPSGAYDAAERTDAIMGEGGVEDCGNAQNCVKACPKQIPLTESIAVVGRAATVRALKKFVGI